VSQCVERKKQDKRGGEEEELGRKMSQLCGANTTPTQFTVAVRIRPSEDLDKTCWKMNPTNIVLKSIRKKSEHEQVTVHKVLGEDVLPAEVFDTQCQPLVDQVMQGRNSTIFAYGQTGSGKTFSMEGPPEEPGIVPQTIDSLFGKFNNKEKKLVLTQSDVAVILIGANDAMGSLSEERGTRYLQNHKLPQLPTMNWFSENIEILLKRLTEEIPGGGIPRVAICTLTPLGDHPGDAVDQLVVEVNSRIRSAVAASNEKKKTNNNTHQIEILDLYKAIRDELPANPTGKAAPFAIGMSLFMWNMVMAGTRYYILGQSWASSRESLGGVAAESRTDPN
jgi:hypothetical protein